MKKVETQTQKVKNAIKIILILLPLILFSQKKIEGKYNIHKENYFHDISTNFTFFKNGTFAYEQSQDFGIQQFGSGHYFINKDSLMLNYDLTKLMNNSYHVYKYYKNNKDSITIKLNIYDYNGKIISNQPIIILSDKTDYVSNKYGKVEINMKKENKQIELNIPDSLFGYNFKIFKDCNYEIDVFLNTENLGIGIKNQIMKYKIVEQKDDFIKLKNTNGIIKLVKQTE